MEKTTINERLKVLIDKLGMNNNSFAAKVGVTPQGIGPIVKGTSTPSFTLIEKILEAFPSLSEKWLVRGMGPMFITNEPETSGMPKVLNDYLQEYLKKIEESFKITLETKDKALLDKDLEIQRQSAYIERTQRHMEMLLNNLNSLPGKQPFNEHSAGNMWIAKGLKASAC